jgi:hypothetical protein
MIRRARLPALARSCELLGDAFGYRPRDED